MPTQPIPKCPACGSEVMEPGMIGAFGAGGFLFGPDKKGFELSEGVRAIVCLDCGHVSLWLKSRFDLSGLRKARDAGRLKER
jgi:DNA-directed RNA polymerase subunit RPC12/RpoP